MTTRSSRSILRLAFPVSAMAIVPSALATQPHDVDIPAQRLADTLAGSASGMSTTSTFASSNGLAVFRASSGVSGVYRVWASSGRPGGTYSIPGTDGVATDPVALPGTGKVLVYTGTGSLRPLVAVDASKGDVQVLAQSAMNPLSTGLIFAGSRAIFMAPVAGINTLWATDGTPGGTGPVVDSAAGTVGNITPAAHSVYFTTRSASNVYTLWKTDGTLMNPTRVTDLHYAPTWTVASSGFRAIGDRVLFAQPSTVSGMNEVWVSDGTQAGTTMVTTTPTLSSVLAFPNDGTGLYTTRMLPTSVEFWRMSSTASECRSLMTFAHTTQFFPLGEFDNMTIFGDQGGGSQYNVNNANAITLWVTDGTPDHLLGIPGFPGAQASGTLGNVQTGAATFVMSGDTLFVESAVGTAGHEPWRMNLSTGELGQLRDIIPGGGSSNPTKFFALSGGHGAGFFAYDIAQHTSLFVSDGSPDGTRIVSRLTGTTYQYSPTAVGSRVFFVGGLTSGLEPYAVDLCPADYNNSGAVTVDDLFGYLVDWFAGNHAADMDNSGGAPDINDLMGYFNTWMAGCPS